MKTIAPRGARGVRAEAVTHRLAMGQSVRLKDASGHRSHEVYRITGFVPARGDQPQYRIRSDEERHERLATEDSLDAVFATAPGGDLIEKTFADRNQPAAGTSVLPANGET